MKQLLPAGYAGVRLPTGPAVPAQQARSSLAHATWL
jgi:hypothetical protein